MPGSVTAELLHYIPWHCHVSALPGTSGEANATINSGRVRETGHSAMSGATAVLLQGLLAMIKIGFPKYYLTQIARIL